MARSRSWITLVALAGLAALAAGCGGSGAPEVNMCGNPPHHFALSGGSQVVSGDCPGYPLPKPPAVTVRRGETFTMTPGNSAIGVPPVPQPNGPAVVVVSLARTPHDGTMATYRAAQPGRALLLVPHYRQLCLDPKLGCSQPPSRSGPPASALDLQEELCTPAQPVAGNGLRMADAYEPPLSTVDQTGSRRASSGCLYEMA